MKIRNIWSDVPPPLHVQEDDRGRIVDIFYQEDINHVGMITSEAGAVRGNHYHKLTTQHVLVTRGALEYWSKPAETETPATCAVARAGDLCTSPPMEVHAMRMLEPDTEFMVFCSGPRGGKDYESDTFRVSSIVP